jgi:signal transduction histidine kinase
MSRRLARLLAVGALVACVASTVTGIALHYADWSRVPTAQIVVIGDRSTPEMQQAIEELEQRIALGEPLRGSGEGGSVPAIVAVVFLLAIWVGIGVLIVFRQPTSWAGWLFIITGAPLPLLTLVDAVVVHGVKVDPGSIPAIGAWATVGEYLLYPVALIPLLFLLYPDGRVPGPRWRWSVVGLVGGTTLAFVAFLLRPGPFNNWRDDGILYENPLGIDGLASTASIAITVGTLVALASALSTVVAVRQRFRRSTGEQRQQMRWLVFVASLVGGLLLLGILTGVAAAFLGIAEGGEEEPPIFPILFGLTAFTIVVGIPSAYLVALLRYRLWDLDIVIRKAVVFGVVATAITLLALLVVLFIPVVFVGTGLSGWELGLLAFGVAIGFLVGPLRRRARRLADRIVYRQRATPYEVLTAFSERMGETYSTEDVLPRMVQVLASATGATSARVLLRVGHELHEVARWPRGAEGTGEAQMIPVSHLGEELGALAVTMPANDPMDPSKERLVRDLASQAGLVLRNVRLIEELRASRQRLVAAQDEERRRLERNLHDGAQQQLVALAVQLRLAEQMVGRDAEKERAVIHRLQNAANEALEDLRDLARGIYPPLLADRGLEAALEAQARKSPVPVVVEAEAIGRYPRDVESAVYFCTLEALNNVSKYADASRAVVRLAQSNGQLTFTVTDDGRGFDPETTGSGTGLQGMADRLDAIGGHFDVASAPGAGTTVTGRVPVGAPE